MRALALLVVPFVPLAVIVPMMSRQAPAQTLPVVQPSPRKGFLVPPQGTAVSLPPVDTQGRKLPAEGRALLVVAGSCLGCTSHLPEVETAAQAKNSVTVVWAEAGSVPGELRRKLKGIVFYDPRQLLLPFEFRTRTPAAYVVDLGTHRFLKAQGEDEGFADFVRRSR